MIARVFRLCRLRLGLALLCAVLGTAASSFDAQVQVTGGDKDLRESLTQSSLVMTAMRDEVTAPLDILAAAQADYGNILTTLYDRGYFGPDIRILVDGREASGIPPLSKIRTVRRVQIFVKSGPAFQLGRVQINPLAPTTQMPEGFAPGQPAQVGLISEAAERGIDGWRDLGFAKAKVVQEAITANHRKAELNVIMVLDPGPAVTFGKTRIPKPSAVRKDRIRRIAGIPQGKPFDPVELERAVKRLRRTGAFSAVTLREAEELGPGDTMDIELELADAKPRRFGFGAEIESVEGLTLSGYWLHRNLLGGAERLRFEAEFAGLGGETEGVDTTLRLNFTRPSTFDSDTDLYGLAELEQLDEPLFFSEQVNVEVGINHYYSERLEASIGLAYRFSDVRDELGSRTFSHLTVPMSATLDKRDDKLDATRGLYLSFEGLPYLGLNGSQSGARAYLDARSYRRLGDSDVVLAGRLQFGTIFGSSLAGTPSDLLFLSGGSGTVRGQSYQSLSIRTGTARTGGRSFLGLAGEARFPVAGKFGGVVFYDIGYIGRNSTPDGSGDWHSGAGLGVRYDTSFGPIRFDVAVPVTGPDTSGFEFYIGIGQAF